KPLSAGGSPSSGARPAISASWMNSLRPTCCCSIPCTSRAARDDIKEFMTDFRRAFTDLNFWGTADLIAEGDYVVGQWEGGSAHTGPAFSDFLMGSLPPATGRKMHFTGTTVLRIQNGKITQEIGLDDGVKALTQLGLIKAA